MNSPKQNAWFMSVLEIRHRTGRIETRELSKAVPLLVGQLASSDIRVEADGVAPVHCRISWKRKNFEVAAVSAEGVQFNGAMVRNKVLLPGDVIRVGDVEIVLLAEPRQLETPPPAAPAVPNPATTSPAKAPFADTENRPAGMLLSQYELQSITTDSLPVRSFHISSQLAAESEKQKTAAVPNGSPALPGSGKELKGDADGERHAGMSRVDHADLAPAELNDLNQSEIDLDRLAEHEQNSMTLDSPFGGRVKPKPGAAGRPLRRLPCRVRPGERDPLRSPLVIGLLSGSLLLLLSAATLWFVMSREKSQRQYNLAKTQLQNGEYPQAIESFELFLHDNPRHALAAEARVDIGTARVEQSLGGGSPAWDKGLEAVQAFIDDNRNSKPFQDPESLLRQFVLKSADRIAFGAIETARALHKRPLLSASAEAVKLIEFYSRDNLPEDRLKELAHATQAADAAILQHDTFDAAVQKIDEALGARQSAVALREYRHVLDRYRPPDSPGYAAVVAYRPLTDRLKKACDLERVLTTRDESPGAPPATAIPEKHNWPQLTLARRNRARTDVVSTGATAFALAEDCLYGVDSATGEPLWRRVIGLESPFAPVPVSAGQPALLVWDGRQRELVLLLLRTGDVVWRLPLATTPVGAPRVHEGQIYLTTAGDLLEQIDLQSGHGGARLKFPQKVVGPCAVSLSGERLYVPGHENVLYVLTRRPLACEQVVWLGHAPGAIQAPAVMMRHLLLLSENDRQKECLLRVLNTEPEDRKPAEIATQRIKGQVRDLPILRGKELLVPSSPGRVSAFVVAETGDERSLSFVATSQVKNAGGSPIFLSTGPDGQMWTYCSALRRFELTQNSLLPEKEELAVGLASQPLQVSGDSLFLGRRLPYSRAVLFSEADRQQMAVQWQVALGAGILAATTPAGQDGSVLCVTTLGDLFQVTPQKLARGGFDLQALGQIPVPEGLSESLSAVRLSDGRLAVYCSGAEPRLWLPGSDGMSRERKLTRALQTDPVRLAGGLLLALPGRLRLVGRPAGEPAVEDLPAPLGQAEPPRWTSLAAIDETHALVLSEKGRVARIQFGIAPVPHLEEITDWEAGSPVDLPLALAGDRIFLVDAASRLVMLKTGTLEPMAETTLEATAAARPRPIGDQVLVELKADRLVSFDAARKLEKKWELPLSGGALTGDPLVADGRLIVALSSGRILWVDRETGKETRTLDLGQQLGFGPQQWGELIVVGTIDGTLISLNGRVNDRQWLQIDNMKIQMLERISHNRPFCPWYECGLRRAIGCCVLATLSFVARPDGMAQAAQPEADPAETEEPAGNDDDKLPMLDKNGTAVVSANDAGSASRLGSLEQQSGDRMRTGISTTENDRGDRATSQAGGAQSGGKRKRSRHAPPGGAVVSPHHAADGRGARLQTARPVHQRDHLLRRSDAPSRGPTARRPPGSEGLRITDGPRRAPYGVARGRGPQRSGVIY